MKKVFGVLLLLCLLVLSKTVFADTSHAPPIEGQQIEMTIENDLVLENVVLTPVKFMEVEISPGDILETTTRIDKLRNSLNSKLSHNYTNSYDKDTKHKIPFGLRYTYLIS